MRNVSAITMFVEEPTRSKAFYELVFGARVVHQDGHSVALAFDGLIVNLLVRSEAAGLLEPAPVAPADAGSGVLLTVDVEDVDDACTALAERGVVLLNGPQDRPWGIRTAAFADPDGHVWEIAAPLAGGGD